MNKKTAIMRSLVVGILFFLFYFNFPIESNRASLPFGTYLDTASYQLGYSFNQCIIDAVNFSTDATSSFYFGCNLDRDGPDYPIGFIATFPFHIEKRGIVCYSSWTIPACSDAGICRVIFNRTDEDMCIKPASEADGYILWSVFNNSNEALSPQQFWLTGSNIFHKVYPERLRFEMPIASNEILIAVDYCLAKGWGEGCAKLKLPNRLEITLRIPKDAYDFDFDKAFSQPMIKYEEGVYRIHWDDIQDISTSTIRFDLIDKNMATIKAIFNFFASGILFMAIGFLVGGWWEKREKSA